MERKIKKDVVESELEILDGVIDYCDRMIKEGDLEYRLLKKNAYEKTVIVEGELGKEEFRLSSTSLVYPNRKSGYATPHSPVGRLCSVAFKGYSGESNLLGKYVISEIRRFVRKDVALSEKDFRDFSLMEVDAQEGDYSIMGLRSYLLSFMRSRQDKQHSPTSQDDKEANASDINPPPGNLIPAETKNDDLPIKLELVGEEINLEIIEDEEPGLSYESDDIEPVGLDSSFFLNRTINQDKVISRSPFGPMWVEGVAGSGKTSAALGRTKMLCDFNENNVWGEKEFKNVLGDDFDYWDEKYAGKFSLSTSIGFVKTGELILYLKDTCSRMDMSELPVQEYHALRDRLVNYRKLLKSSVSKRMKYREASLQPVVSSMAWMGASEVALLRCLSDKIDRLHAGTYLNDSLELVHEIQTPLLRLAVEDFISNLKECLRARGNLSRDNDSNFKLNKLAESLYRFSEDISEKYLGKDVKVAIQGSLCAFSKSWHDLAAKILEEEMPLANSQGNPIIILNEKRRQVGYKNYKFFDAKGEEVSWGEFLKEGGECTASILGEQPRVPILINEDEFFLHVQNNKIFTLEDARLERIVIHNGLGSSKVSGSKFKTPKFVFEKISIKMLIAIFSDWVENYLYSLVNYSFLYPSGDVAGQASARIKNGEISDEDIDLLLCITQEVFSDFSNRKFPPHMQDTPKYSSVFIDEAQDFTEQQIFLMASQADSRYQAVTAVGDLAQQLLNEEEKNVIAAFPKGMPPKRISLEKNLRQKDSSGIEEISSIFRELIFSQDKHDSHYRSIIKKLEEESRGEYLIRFFSSKSEEYSHISKVIEGVDNRSTVAVIYPDDFSAMEAYEQCSLKLDGLFRRPSLSGNIELSRKYLIHFTSIFNVKGLEFDVVILGGIQGYDFDLASHRKRFYVGVSRPRKNLYICGSS